MMKTRKFQLAFVALMLFGAIATKISVQAGEFKLGPAVSLVMPTGDFKDLKKNFDEAGIGYYTVEHGTGFGISAAAKYGLNDFLSIVGDLGWNSVPETINVYNTYPEKAAFAKENTPVADESGRYDFIDFTVGVRANVGFLYAEARTGYFSGDQGGFGFIPAIGGEFKNFDLQANYTIVGSGSYFGMRLAYYFGL